MAREIVAQVCGERGLASKGVQKTRWIDNNGKRPGHWRLTHRLQTEGSGERDGAVRRQDWSKKKEKRQRGTRGNDSQ